LYIVQSGFLVTRFGLFGAANLGLFSERRP